MNKKVKVWAHRGASGYAPENTMPAFYKAIQIGADGIELDVQLSKDGQVVVIHDETIDRVSSGIGYVCDMTFDELRRFNYNNTVKTGYERVTIPLLEEVLELLQETPLTLNIELKNSVLFYYGLEDKVYKLVKKYHMEERVIFSSFNHASLLKMKQIDAEVKVGILYQDLLSHVAQYAEIIGANAIHPCFKNLNQTFWQEWNAEKENKQLNVWTVNSFQDIKKMIQNGADTLITNYPDLALRIINKMEEESNASNNQNELGKCHLNKLKPARSDLSVEDMFSGEIFMFEREIYRRFYKKGMRKHFLEAEVLEDYYVNDQLKLIWAVQLDLLAHFDQVCKENQISYFIDQATLLGAVRGNGYIPWVKNIDVIMPREDYDFLRSIAGNVFHKPYYWQDCADEVLNPDSYLGTMSRLQNIDTTGIEGKNYEIRGYHGIWIDIMVFDKISDNERERRRQLKKVSHFQRLLIALHWNQIVLNMNEVQKEHCLTNIFGSKRLLVLYSIIASLQGKRFLYKKLEASCKLCKGNSNTLINYGRYVDIAHLKLYNSEDYKDSILMEFEYLVLRAPIGWKNVLRTEFGQFYSNKIDLVNYNFQNTGIFEPMIPFSQFKQMLTKTLHPEVGKTVIIFGAGQMLEHYLEHTSEHIIPKFIVDNNPCAWNQLKHGIQVKSPQAILEVPKENLHLIICSYYYKEIARQLFNMGIKDYYIYVQRREWLR